MLFLSACNEKQENIKTEVFQHKQSEQVQLQEIEKSN